MSTHVMQGTAAHYPDGSRAPAVQESESRVCHLWAAQAQSHARFRAIYFSGRTLYSYGSHYIIGRLMDDGAVLLNSERNSKTTNGHRDSARYATNHKRQVYVPDLTRFLKLLRDYEAAKESLARERKQGADIENPESYGFRQALYMKAAKNSGAAFIRDNAAELTPDDGAYLVRLFGFPPATFGRLVKEAERRRLAEEKAAARQRSERQLADAKMFGDMSDSDFRRFWPSDSYDREPDSLASGYGNYAQAAFRKRLAAAHKASKAAGYTDRTKRLWQRLKTFREYESGRPARERQAAIAKLRVEFDAWRQGNGPKPAAWRFSDPELTAERQALEAATEAERQEIARRDYEAWRETPTACKRPDSSRYPEGSTERGVLEGFERADMESAARQLESWRRNRELNAKPDSGMFSPSRRSRYPDIFERLGGDPWEEIVFNISKAEAERRLAEKAEAERLKALSMAEKAAAWQAGASLSQLGNVRISDPEGGALLRVKGEQLETSHGAAVPLEHAIRVFQFVKLCRERGESWQRNGRQIRVGHYNLDSISPDGSFRAGCHEIHWQEIERVAKSIGVFDIEPKESE